MIELLPFHEPAEAANNQIVYKLAASQHEREAAFRLVYDAYRRLDLVPQNRFRMRVTAHHLLPTTDVFVASRHGRVIGTLTLVGDGELGLPMEDVYGVEIARSRSQGDRLGEATSLALRRGEFRRLYPVFIRLTQLMFCYSQRRGMSQVVIAVHPRHARFYQRIMKFQVIGVQRPYPLVRHEPAVALCLDFDRVRREHPDTHRVLFSASPNDEELRRQPMSDGESAYFRPIARLMHAQYNAQEADYAVISVDRPRPCSRVA
jgi:hypothetical protein